jgi:methyl-accepting chemotaxis protein
MTSAWKFGLRFQIITVVTGLVAVVLICLSGVAWTVASGTVEASKLDRLNAAIRVSANVLADNQNGVVVKTDEAGNVTWVETPVVVAKVMIHTAVEQMARYSAAKVRLYSFFEVGESRPGWVRTTKGDTTTPHFFIASGVENAETGSRDIGEPLMADEALMAKLFAGTNAWAETGDATNATISGYIPAISAEGKITGLLYVAVPVVDITSQLHVLRNGFLIAGALLILFSAGVAYFIVGGMTRPLPVLAATMHKLADDQMDIELPYLNRGAEIGQMASALQVFKQNAIERQRLRASQEAADSGRAARQKAIDAEIERFRRDVKAVTEGMNESVIALRDTAASLVGAANATLGASGNATNASTDARNGIEAVAAATEQLSASINMIAQQVSISSETATVATSKVEATRRAVSGLDETSRRIGSVVELIREIAAQTNLLALNATIEAARAGVAGRGFAVVASEVKALAGQTNRATEEIAQQVTSIQAATAETVQAIEEIAQSVSAVDRTSVGIASAVEQQQASTSEISRAAQDASAGSTRAAENMSAVASSINGVTRPTEMVTRMAEDLAGRSRDLNASVERFLTGVAAA